MLVPPLGGLVPPPLGNPGSAPACKMLHISLRGGAASENEVTMVDDVGDTRTVEQVVNST